MRVAQSNILLDTTPVVTSGASSGDASAITDPDHSTLYVSGSNTLVQVDFGLAVNISYVGISGHNLGDSANNAGTIRLQDGATVILEANFSRNKIVMFNFDARTFTNLRLVLVADGGTVGGNIFLSYVSAGVSFEVPNDGQVAGFKSANQTRPVDVRVSSNRSASPTAYVKQRKPLNITLALPNMLTSFIGGDWQSFLDFAESQPFFLNESDTTYATAIMAFEPVFSSPTAHAQTRSLKNTTIKFKAFNGL